jgi:PadR family transcriptional regulator, regulatory protein PadR
MKADKLLLQGNLELILLTILTEAPMYGLEIINETNARTQGYFEFKEGSLYPALHRLTEAKLLEAEFRPSDKGGPRRRYYFITEKGKVAQGEKNLQWEAFNQAFRDLRGTI